MRASRGCAIFKRSLEPFSVPKTADQPFWLLLVLLLLSSFLSVIEPQLLLSSSVSVTNHLRQQRFLISWEKQSGNSSCVVIMIRHCVFPFPDFNPAPYTPPLFSFRTKTNRAWTGVLTNHQHETDSCRTLMFVCWHSIFLYKGKHTNAHTHKKKWSHLLRPNRGWPSRMVKGYRVTNGRGTLLLPSLRTCLHPEYETPHKAWVRHVKFRVWY